MRHLVEVHRALTSDLPLLDVLDRILRCACSVVSAPRGVLGVLRPDGVLDQFVHHGLDEPTVARIHALPSVPGNLAQLAADLTVAPSTFAHVPIEIRDEACGDLYLWAEPDGIDAADGALLAAFAATAAAAIAKHRLVEDAHRSRDWLNASGEISRALLAGADVDMLLDVVSRALHVAEADFAALVLPDSTGQLRATVAVGLGAENYSGYVFEADASVTAEVVKTGHSVLLPDVSDLDPEVFPSDEDFGPLMVTPLVDAKGVRGAVLLVRVVGRAQFTHRDLDLASTFADQVALALEMDEARNDAEYGRVLEVRNRIAEDLHDNVMQRLFATGVGLQDLAEAAPAEISERLARHISDLDDTIDEIRERVFGLRGNPGDQLARVPGRFPHVTPDNATPDPAATRDNTR